MSESQPSAIREVGGSEALIQWFGYWPDFHDATLLGIELNPGGTSCVRIHTWEMTKEVDAKGYYVLQKHVFVSFFLDGLKDTQMEGFPSQNTLMELTVARTTEGLELLMDSVYGVVGSLTADAIRVEIEPGKLEKAETTKA